MHNTKILDCTLRDGGYINEWHFGKENIEKVIRKLINANIDIVECGFVSQRASGDTSSSKFSTIESLFRCLPKHLGDSLPVCMINFGEYDINDIPINDNDSPFGIRVAFHKDDRFDALEFCNFLKDKGYFVFLQPMVSDSYTDFEFLDLISKTNDISPFAFYIVDSFGVMHNNDLLRLFYLVEHNLNANICIGYHSHNNLQMAFSNAQLLTNINTNREIIVDSSLFGMGRGAGNLNTELFAEYMNNEYGTKYNISIILQIVDEVINGIYTQKPWGYSLPHYISAKHNCHPNYASYLVEKSTLLVNNIDEILKRLDNEKRSFYDESYIEELYSRYQGHWNAGEAASELKDKFNGRNVLVLAPGTSIYEEAEKISKAALSVDTVIVSVNFIPKHIDVDYIFVSNIRRFEALGSYRKVPLIVTSNIEKTKGIANMEIVSYNNLLNEHSYVKDNAGLMFIKLMIILGAKKILLAGMDGYAGGTSDNYVNKDMAFIKMPDEAKKTNEGISNVLSSFNKSIEIEFVTGQRFISIKQDS